MARDPHSPVTIPDTLDPTTRQVYLPEVKNAVVTDTVGFIRKLPTHLIEAFKATLEESGEEGVVAPGRGGAGHALDEQVAPSQALEQQFAYFADHFQSVNEQTLRSFLAGEGELDRPGILISFDDGFRNHFEVAAA